MKVITLYGLVDAQLDLLQKAKVAQAAARKTVNWALVQRAPGIGVNAGRANREAAENDNVAGKYIQVTKQYEYFRFGGAYDSETHPALCDNFYATQAGALAGVGRPVQISCQSGGGADLPYLKAYWTIDPGPGTALYAANGTLGRYIGAHVNEFNVK